MLEWKEPEHTNGDLRLYQVWYREKYTQQGIDSIKKGLYDFKSKLNVNGLILIVTCDHFRKLILF